LRWHFAVLLAVIIFFGAIRWRLADMPLERDEGEYAYAGQLILQGIPPYQLAYNMKLPGSYAAYAAILAMFGQTARGVHIGLLLVSALSIFLLYLITARLFGALAGLIAGASYGFLTTQPGVYGLAAHATHFVVLAALIGIILLLRADETKSTALFFLCGLAFGCAFLMKQPGILLGAFAFLYLAINSWPKNRREWGPWAKHLSIFLLGAALPFALTCALLYRAGVFANFWFWTFSYARQYANTVPLLAGWALLKASCSYILSFTTPWLWVLALAGIFAFVWDATVRPRAVFVLGLLIFSFAAVCLGLYFRPHYFILLIPAVSILIAVAITSATRLLSTKLSYRWLRVVPAILFTAACAVAIHHNAQLYFTMSPLEATRLSYSTNPFPEAAKVADYLREHTARTDTIMVLGSEPEIYFEAHRHSASGYIYTYSLGEDQSYWHEMQRQMMREVEASRPAYVVLVNISFSWLMDPNSPQGIAFRAWMKEYVSANFEEVGMVEVSDSESRYFWGDEASKHHRPGSEILIFKRKG
jgi:4-amino-4-deoxy-L-arabinose transferase-like glycosyltransferase